MLQVLKLHKRFDRLQLVHGDKSLKPIYGAGRINSPKFMFVFMNPTARNVSSKPTWTGLRAPWLGTKSVWEMFYKLELLDRSLYEQTLIAEPGEWNSDLALAIYTCLANNSIYLTNLAKCTQLDARPLGRLVFQQYLELMYEEIEFINPENIIAFGNQVSSLVLGRSISVGNYISGKRESLNLTNRIYRVFPVYYPVGQGRRNMPLAIKAIQKIIGEE